VNVRWRDDTNTQDRGKPIAVEEAVDKLRKLRDDRGSYNPFPSIAKSAAETKSDEKGEPL
jgi:threonyl-tRNA synthetase